MAHVRPPTGCVPDRSAAGQRIDRILHALVRELIGAQRVVEMLLLTLADQVGHLRSE